MYESEPGQSQGPLPPRRAGAQLPASMFSWAITGINVIVFVGTELTGGSDQTRNLILWGANAKLLVAQGEFWRLLTAVFLHGSTMHLLFNSFALLTFGRLSEAVFGHRRFLAIYLISGIFGSLLSYFFSSPRSVSVGASGAIFGVATALAVFLFLNRPAFKLLGDSPLAGILLVLGINVVIGFVQPRVDNWGHLGGILGGAALAMYLAPKVVPMHDREGEVAGLRWEPSSPASWLIVPAALAVIGGTLVASWR